MRGGCPPYSIRARGVSEITPASTDASRRRELRKRMRTLRRGLGQREREYAARRLAQRLYGACLFVRSARIAFYLPMDGEIDPTPLIERARAMNKQCFLPVLNPLAPGRLWFAPYGEREPLHCNRFNIPEPALKGKHMAPAWALDLILLPLVAFDTQGNRLGMGGGFYDRTLAFLSRRRYWRKPRLLGLAYEFQKVPALHRAPWDIPLQGIVTEAGFYRTAPLP